MRTKVPLALLALGLGCNRVESIPSTNVTVAHAPNDLRATPSASAEQASTGRLRPLTIETKKKSRQATAKRGTTVAPGAGATFEPNAPCEESISWPVVRGSATPEIDARINRALENDKWILADQNLSACETGQRARASRGFEVVLNDRGVLALRQVETSRYEGSVSPWNAGPERWLAFDVLTGAPLSWKDLVVESPATKASVAKLLDRCIRAYVKDVNGGDANALADMQEKVALDKASLVALPTPHGLRFAGLGYAPLARVLEGQGPTVTWAALLREGAVRMDGPAARLTEGVKAAGPNDTECRLRD
jgi:hypothetical protein